ncbi:MAG: chitobiase/beta-hexosaminidase C-terminal domain-containing protein [Bacteroidales bacterium]|nr:chitobiase/beta-hexosaminidase C-terminal domain-containing protein [Bacteroidales bacterium]
MKRKFTLIITALMLMITSFAWGQTREEVVAYTLDGTITGGSSGYATESEITQDNLTWMVMGNTTMNPWRIGGKSLTNENRPIYSTGTISDNITKIVVTHGTAANVTVNSMTLIVSANADFSNPTSTLTGDFAASSTTTFNRPTSADWSNKYFKIIYNITITQTSNKFLQFIKAEFYKESTQQSVATPTFSPAAGTYYEAQNVTIACTTEGATIYYTTDGNDPTTSSAVYSTPIAISQTTTVKAMAA